MGLFKSKLPTRGQKFDYDGEEVANFTVVGCQYVHDNKVTGEAIIGAVCPVGQNHYFLGDIIESKFEGKPAAKVCLVDTSGKRWHIGWIAKSDLKKYSSTKYKYVKLKLNNIDGWFRQAFVALID